MEKGDGLRLDFRVLGPLEAFGTDGRAIDLGGRQQQLVLAVLLVNRNAVVSVDRLIDALWGESSPPRAAKNIQVHVSRLRRALQDPSSHDRPQEGILRTRGNGYILELQQGQLDVDRFERLVEEARRALAADEPEHAGGVLEEALALWRGPPLADFAYDSFAQGEIARLEELRLAALEESFEAALVVGRHPELISDLQRLAAEHPLRERLRGQLMLALYRCGRKAEALRVYDDARRLLAEELGIEPSESLRRLHSAMLADDPALAAPAEQPRPRRRAAASPAATPSRWLLGVGGLLLLSAALGVAMLGLTRDRTTAGIASVTPNSLARIDPDTNRVVAEIPVGARPASVVFANGALWVANLDDRTVSRVDPGEHRVVRTLPTGSAPLGLANTHGAVWAIGGKGLVRRIDPEFNEVAEPVEMLGAGTFLGGYGPLNHIAANGDALWAVTGAVGSAPRLFRVDPRTRRAKAVLPVGLAPTAIAAGFGDLWVTDAFENTVSRVDPLGVVERAITVGGGASAVAAGEGAVWVVSNVENSVARIDPQTNSVTATIPVGRHPSAIAVGSGSVWVANTDDGSVSRIDPETNRVVAEIPLGAAPAGLASGDGSIWVTSQASAAPETAATSGVVRVEVSYDAQTDPAFYSDLQIAYATCAKLLNYPDAPGRAGTRLVPEVAASLPTRSADGRTYTFSIRKGFAFSPPRREAVTAETFKRSIERSLHPMFGLAGHFLNGIAGQSAYESGRAKHISGIVARGDTLTITLDRPAGDFLARLAMPFSCAVPLDTPIRPEGVRAIPSAGPYYIAEHVPDKRIVLKRNPNYHGPRPRRPREIRFKIGVPPAQAVADVEAGRADYALELPGPGAEARVRGRYGPGSEAAREGGQRYFVNPTLTLGYLALNTSRRLFSDVRLRRAVNYAIDRRALSQQGHPRLSGGEFPLIPTDQYLPPGMPGASRERLYPPAGDVRAARRIAPNVRGKTAVLYTCDLPHCRRQARVITSNLRAIGLGVEVEEFESLELVERAVKRGAPYDILAIHWLGDYADPSTFLEVLFNQQIMPTGNMNLAYYVDAGLARRLEELAPLSGDARYRAYGALATTLARDDAPWVVYGVGTSHDFFSERIGCQIFQPVSYGIDLGALCVTGGPGGGT